MLEHLGKRVMEPATEGKIKTAAERDAEELSAEETDVRRQLLLSRVLLIILAVLGLLAIAVVIYFYHYKFGPLGLSENQSIWGQFGDYVGGLANPVVGLLALIGLLWTIYQNQKELTLTRQEMKKSAKALKESNYLTVNTQTLNQITITLNFITQRLDELSEKTIEIYSSKGSFDKITYRNYLLWKPSPDSEVKFPPWSESQIEKYNSDLDTSLRLIIKGLLTYQLLAKDSFYPVYFGYLFKDIVNAAYEKDIIDQYVWIMFNGTTGDPDDLKVPKQEIDANNPYGSA